MSNNKKGYIMKASKTAPQWAIDLVEQVCNDYNRGMPGELKWNAQGHKTSGGRCSYAKNRYGHQIYYYRRLKSGKLKRSPFRGRISIKASTEQQDQELVLLHELAHWVVVRTRSMGHTVHFWKKAFELYQRYGVDMTYAYSREKDYKQKAVQVYERYYKTD